MQFSVPLTGSLIFTFSLNDRMLGRKSEERDRRRLLHLEGSAKNEHPILTPCRAIAMARATALGSAGPLPEAHSAW